MYIKLPHPSNTRHPINCDDWGDLLTVGLHVKTRDPKSKEFEFQFGVYMGENKIGIKNWESVIVTIVTYINAEEMRKEWVLD